MKITKLHLLILSAILFIIACGSGSGGDNDLNAEFVASKTFSFNASIDSGTLTQEDDIILRDSFHIATRDESYTIQSIEDLNAFNITLSDSEQVSIGDLDEYGYFFIRAANCPDYYDYSYHSYSYNMLTINLDHFHQPNVLCLAVIEEKYVVFKAMKSS